MGAGSICCAMQCEKGKERERQTLGKIILRSFYVCMSVSLFCLFPRIQKRSKLIFSYFLMTSCLDGPRVAQL